MTSRELQVRRARAILAPVRPHLGGEVLLLVLLYTLFSRVQGALGHDPAAALAHARGLQHLESVLGLQVERPANHAVAGVPWLATASAVFYGVVLAGPPLVLAVVYLARPDVYRAHRRSLVALTLLSLPAFWLWPVAPPRFALDGITDLVATRSFLAASVTPGTTTANLYASTPSLHVAWSLWCAVALAAMLPARWRVLPYLFPLLVALDVIVTGNHYVVDVLAAVALVVLALRLEARLQERSRGLLAQHGRGVRAGAPGGRVDLPC